MKEKILKALKEIEKKNNVKIVMVIESGSRAWGFASKDSDYDVRCMHVGKIKDYLGLNTPAKQINFVEEDLDIESWDVKKFAELTLSSNPQIAEWLRSPIIYVDLGLKKKFKEIFDTGCSYEFLRLHYLRMAKQNYHKYMGIGLNHSCKKYLYVLRGIACAKYIEKENKLPPLPYKEVIPFLPKFAEVFFEKCVVKKNSTEKAEILADSKVVAFIEESIGKVGSVDQTFSEKDALNSLLVSSIEKFGV